MNKSRTKKYLLFMFGGWIRLEDNVELYGHIKDVLETILAVPELSFVTGEHTLIACIESHASFREIKELLEEFLKPTIPAYFLMPKPRNLSYRLNPLLEQHLFGKKNNKNPFIPPPEMIKENYNPDLYFKNNENLDIDIILDKINDKGMDSLTIIEKEFLDNQKKQ